MFDFTGTAINARSSRHNNAFQRPVLAITYSVTGGGTPSTDATLSTLTIDTVNALPGAAPSGAGFTHNINNATTSVTLAYTTTHTATDVAITSANGTVTGHTVTGLPEGDTAITITVTAEDTTTTRAYTITVSRAAPAGQSTDASLQALTVNTIDALPDAASLPGFVHTVTNSVTSVIIEATPTHALANAVITASALATVDASTGVVSGLPVGDTAITVTVTAEDGTTEEVYTINVNRAAPAVSANATTVVLQQGRVPVVDATRNNATFNHVGAPGPTTLPLYSGTALGATPYTGTIDVGAMSRRGTPVEGAFLQANPGGPTLTNFNGNTAWLMYFDLAVLDTIPAFSDPSMHVTIEQVTLYLHNTNNATTNLSLHRVLDNDGIGTALSGPGWVPGTDDTNRHGTPAPATMNNGVSWSFRNNGFAAVTPGPPPATAPAGQVGWTNVPGSTLADSVASAPSANLQITIGRGLNSWSSISGAGMISDIEAWLADPSSNQGWMFDFVLNSGQFNARSSRDPLQAGIARPVLAITYSVTEGPPVTRIDQAEPTPQQNGFDLSWTTTLENADTITSYVIAWSGNGETGAANATASPFSLRSHHFTYDEAITITIRGYNSGTLIATSNARTETIVDNRETTAAIDGFTHTWSQVYGAVNYVVYYGDSDDYTTWTQSTTVTAATATITGLAQGTWYYRVVAYGAASQVLRTGEVRYTEVDGPSVTLTGVTPAEDRFTLTWTAQSMNDFSLVYTPDGGSAVTVPSVTSPFTIGSADFDYGVQIEFTIRGYNNNAFVAESNALTSQILDRRATRPFSDGFSYTWSAVYGAQLYVVNYWLANDTVHTVTTTNPTITIRDAAVFEPGQVWNFEVIAYSTPTVDATAVLRTITGMTVTIREPSGPVDLEPQTLTLRQGVDGYTGTRHVGFIIPGNAQRMGASLSPGIMLGVPDGRGLIYFDLEDVFPPDIDTDYIFVTNVMLSMFQSFNVTGPDRDIQISRILDPDNLGMWVAGTNSDTSWSINSRNNGASWFNRDNGFDLPGQADPPDRTPIPWTLSGDGNLDDSVAAVPSAVTTVGNHQPFTNNRMDFTGSQMGQDVNTWIQDPASNQGWMFSRVDPTAPVGPHFWGSHREPITQRPMLTLTYLDLSDLGDDVVIFLNDVTPDEDGFFLQWFPFGEVDSFVIEYEVDGLPRSITTTDTYAWVRNHEFIYDTDFAFVIAGYFNGARVAESDPKTGQIVDKRAFTPTETGFDMTWSRVYGALSYSIEVTRLSDSATITVTATETSIVVNDPAFFTFGFFTYRLTAIGDSGTVLRDSGVVQFERPDVTPPITTVNVENNATWATTASDAMLLPPNRGPVTLTVQTATDLESGVSRTEYRFNNDHQFTFQESNPGVATNSQNLNWVLDPWHPTSVGSTITITAQGVTRVWVRSVDNAGNVECPTPIYVVIENSPLYVGTPVVRSGADVLSTLQPGATITAEMELINRDPDGGGFTAYIMAVLYDASGAMRDLVMSSSMSFSVGVTAILTTAPMTLPSNTSGWYMEIFLLDAENDNPFFEPHMFPHTLNMHRHLLHWRPMVNSLTTNATPPIITQHPRGLMIVNSAIQSGETFTLTTAGESIDDGVIEYQWYRSTDSVNFTPISGATSASFDVDVSALGGNGTYYFRARVINFRADATGQNRAYELGHTTQIIIVDEITPADIGNRVAVGDTLAADIDIMLGDYSDAELFAFQNNWFKDQNGIWRDAAGLAVPGPIAPILRYIMHPRYFDPNTPPSIPTDAVITADTGNHTVYFNKRGLHGEVSISSLVPDGAVRYFAVQTSIFPGDTTAITPIDQVAALAYALTNDSVLLHLFGEGGSLLQTLDVYLTAGPVVDGSIFLYTYPQTDNGYIFVYTMVGTYPDALTPTTIPADTIVRIRYSDGTWIDGVMVMQYGYLVRDANEPSRWVLSGLAVDAGYYVLSGSAQGYLVEFIPFVPEAIFTVTVNVVPNIGGSVDGLAANGLYQRGETAVLTATAADWFRFEGWFDEDDVLITNNPQHSFEVNFDVALTAKFAEDDGLRTLTLQNGTPWEEFGTALYGQNVTRQGLFDGALGDNPMGAGNHTTDLFIWTRDPAGSNFNTWVQQALIYFELDGYLPSDVDFTIESATLWLGHNRTGPQGGTADLDVFRLLDPNETGMWDRTGNTSWLNKSQSITEIPWYVGGSIDDVRVLSYTIQDVNMENSVPNWLTADVTADVTDWVNGDAFNMGWLLRQNNSVASTTPGLANNPGAITISSSTNTVGWAPQLEIIFRIEFEGERPVFCDCDDACECVDCQCVDCDCQDEPTLCDCDNQCECDVCDCVDCDCETPAINFTVTFNANFAGGMNPNAVTVEEGQPITLPAVTRANHNFAGWFTAATGGVRIGGANQSFVPVGNVTLFAQWTPVVIETPPDSDNNYWSVPSGVPSSPPRLPRPQLPVEDINDDNLEDMTDTAGGYLETAMQEAEEDDIPLVLVVVVPNEKYGVILPGYVINTLAEERGVLTVRRGRFTASYTHHQLYEWGVDDYASVVIILQYNEVPMDEYRIDALIAHAPVNEILLNEVVELRIFVDDVEVHSSANLTRITVYVGDLELTIVERLLFTGIIFDQETGAYRRLGGEFYDDTFVFYSPVAGVHGVIVSDVLTRIAVTIGSDVIRSTINGVTSLIQVDSPAVIINDRTYLPIRFVSYAFGAEVSWVETTRTAVIVLDGTVLSFVVDEPLPGNIGTPFIDENWRTMVPVRYVSEAFGAHVVWDEQTATARIYR